MAIIDVYNQEAQAVKQIEINDKVFGIEPHQQSIFDAVVLYLNNRRQGTHSTKTRAEVSGGGRKPYRQKGTGRARQGSTRAPQWRGGGVAFGPKPRQYKMKMNRKVRRLALRSALSEKFQANEMKVIENLTFDVIKTKKAVALMDKFGFDRKTLFVATPEEDVEKAFLSMSNIPNAKLLTIPQLNVYEIVNSDKIVFTEKAAASAGEVYE